MVYNQINLSEMPLPIETVNLFMKTVPLDVEGLAKALGIIVIKQPLPFEISGKIECETEGNCTVTVNNLHAHNRKRFTLAHEIAHFVLHRHLIGDGIVDNGMYRSNQSDAIERQANRFAAHMLMPASKVIEKYKNGKTLPEQLSLEFGVSSQVAAIRILELQSQLIS